jgi:hypothetical protein
LAQGGKWLVCFERYQLDTDPLPSVFDNVVAYDGVADHVTAYGSVSAENVGGLIEGAIFTRGPKD